MELEFKPLRPATWDDFASLFGERGACGGCWCMWFRLHHAQFEAQKGAANRKAMRDLVASGTEPGLLAYHGGRAIGWCSLAPRWEFVRLERSRILQPVDDTPVWSIVCFFVHRKYRGRGVTVKLLKRAVSWMRQHGGKVLEGYPVDARKGRVAPAFAYHGLAAAFERAGFEECARRSPTRPIMRLQVD